MRAMTPEECPEPGRAGLGVQVSFLGAEFQELFVLKSLFSLEPVTSLINDPYDPTPNVSGGREMGGHVGKTLRSVNPELDFSAVGLLLQASVSSSVNGDITAKGT